MAGIAGYVNWGNFDDRRCIERMTNAISYRLSPGYQLVRTGRLVAVADANRIFHHPNGRTVFLAEGELYNKEELAGYCPEIKQEINDNPFCGLPHLFEKFGTQFAQYLNGIFVIAIYDSNLDSLILIRDHIGCHSAFFTKNRNGIFFGSSIDAIFASRKVEKYIDNEAPACFFSGRALHPPRTMFQKILALSPGTIHNICKDTTTKEEYWNIEKIDIDNTRTEKSWIEELRWLIEDSIKIRYRDKHQIGILLSGGLDTGVVASELYRQNDKNLLKAFSVIFQEQEFSDESPQKILAEHFGIEINQVVLDPKKFLFTLEHAVHFLDSPVNDLALVGMSAVFARAKQLNCQLIFEGQGPDPVFPSSNSHGERQLKKLLNIPEKFRRNCFGSFFPTLASGTSVVNKLQRVACRLGMPENERLLTWRTYFHGSILQELLAPEFCIRNDPYQEAKKTIETCQNSDHINRYQYALIKTFLPDDLLYKDERMAASRGIVNRTPLVDKRLVELALQIPSHMQLNKPSNSNDGIKQLYKKALKGKIPESVRLQVKRRGFSHPTSIWYRGPMRDYMYDTLLSRNDNRFYIFRKNVVRKMLDEHMSQKHNMDYQLDACLIFKLWMNEHA